MISHSWRHPTSALVLLAPSHPSFAIAGVTILLSLTVFSQVVAETMPATSDAVPLLGKSKKRRRWKMNGDPLPIPIPIPPTDWLTRNVYRVLTGVAGSQFAPGPEFGCSHARNFIHSVNTLIMIGQAHACLFVRLLSSLVRERCRFVRLLPLCVPVSLR